MILIWMLFILCRLVFVAEPQAPMAYCRWEYTRLKYIILEKWKNAPPWKNVFSIVENYWT